VFLTILPILGDIARPTLGRVSDVHFGFTALHDLVGVTGGSEAQE
jgi:hypothetical protein